MRTQQRLGIGAGKAQVYVDTRQPSARSAAQR